MNRAALLCIGTKEILEKMIETRQHSGKRDYMKQLFSIPLKDYVAISALKCTPFSRKIVPENYYLNPGYCGEECRELLLKTYPETKSLYIICGIESPGFGYTTYDIVFPQGRCEKGENSRTTALREFTEETGIKLDHTRIVPFLGTVGKHKEMHVYVYKGN